jgi:hypothetical protein
MKARAHENLVRIILALVNFRHFRAQACRASRRRRRERGERRVESHVSR